MRHVLISRVSNLKVKLFRFAALLTLESGTHGTELEMKDVATQLVD